MTIPSAITEALASLQTQSNAAAPLLSADRATVTALRLNADDLVASVETAQYSLAGALDTWTPPVDPVAIANGITGLCNSAIDESAIARMRGLVGRVASNLHQLPQ